MAVKRLWALESILDLLWDTGQVPSSGSLSCFPILVVVRVESNHVCQVSDIKAMLSKCWLVNKRVNGERELSGVETVREKGEANCTAQLAPEEREAGRKLLPETLPSCRTSLVARATKMIPSSSFSVSELSLSSSSSSDSTVKITAAGWGQELSRDGQPSACLLVLHKPVPSPPKQSPQLAQAPASPLAASALA